MEKLVKSGKVKSIGLSNATCPMIYDILAGAEIKPVYNQIESHPYFSNHNLKKTHHVYGMWICAYGSIGSSSWPLAPSSVPKPGSVLQDPVITDIAKKHGRSAA